MTGPRVVTGPRRSDRVRHAVALRAAAVVAGLAVDARLGEPERWHPVAGFGSAMAALEGRWWADGRTRGAAFAGTGAGLAAVAGAGATRLLGTGPALVASTATCAAGRALLEAATSVAAALARGDLDEARGLLPALVGRSPEGLDEKEVARAVIESVAENLVDAVVATALWGLLAGAPGTLVHRAANTLDAMVGHRTTRYGRFGWAAARTDDVLGWPAARLTALLVVAAAPGRARAIWAAVRRDAPRHPSPNAGVAEAAFAAALGLRLGGWNRYPEGVELRPTLGDGRTPVPDDIVAAVALARRVRVVLAVALGLLALVAWRPRSAAGRPGVRGGHRPQGVRP